MALSTIGHVHTHAKPKQTIGCCAPGRMYAIRGGSSSSAQLLPPGPAGVKVEFTGIVIFVAVYGLRSLASAFSTRRPRSIGLYSVSQEVSKELIKTTC
ncbi:hypothetical protein JTB14_007609 [Gonioctena quinquepunctata]|nr:hypothetical protein JTB14_007609 [Gonioctena quinquepunctata]